MHAQDPCVIKSNIGGILLPRCHICNRVPDEGIKGGLKLRKVFICKDCEQDIINLEIGSKNYDHIISKLRLLLK